MLLTKQSIWEAVFTHRFFLTRNDLVRKLKALRKRVTSATACNSWIVKSFPGQAGIPIRKWPPAWKNTPTASVHRTASCEPKLTFTQVHNFKEEGIAGFPATPRKSKTDVGSYNNRAHENWQKKGDYVENSPVFPRRVAFEFRFFLTRCNLICKSIILRKKTCSDMTCNSRIAEFFPGQARISIGKRPSN